MKWRRGYDAKTRRSEVSFDLYQIANQSVKYDLHQHRCIELVFVTEGTGSWWIGNRSGAFSPGFLALIGPGVPHSWNANGESGMRGFVLHIHRSALPAGLLALDEATSLRRVLERSDSGLIGQAQDRDRVGNRIQSIASAKGMLRLARLYALLELIDQQVKSQVIDDKRLKSNLSAIEAARLQGAKDFIQQRALESLTRREVATFLGMEATSFSRFFHRASGITFQDYLVNTRIQIAAKLLAQRRDLSIAEVARESGFHNLSGFMRRFRKRLGTTPLSYRKSANIESLAP